MINNHSKIFLFGTNCASVVNNLSIGLKENGHQVKAISFDFNRSSYNNFSDITCICTDNHPGPFKLVLYKLKGLFMMIKWLLWCDVIHVYGRLSDPAFWIISKLAKRKFVTFVGSDIRMPEVELAINPYFKYAYQNDAYEYKEEGKNETGKLLKYLHALNFCFIVWDVDVFIEDQYKPYTDIVPHASSVNKNLGSLGLQKKVPIVVHSPTAPIAKGTPYVLEAVDKLKAKNIPFEFILLKNLPNTQYQEALARADIYLDQFIWGAYGIAAQQALQMGKVVVNYLTPHRIAQYGPLNPIQNATIDNLDEVLEKLIENIELRQEISGSSKLYYENTHKPSVVANKMIEAYNKLLLKVKK